MARCELNPRCLMDHGHGGDFCVGEPVEPDNPSRRYLYPKPKERLRILAALGPGPYVGVATIAGEVENDPDAIYRTRAGLDQVGADMEAARDEEGPRRR
jgi:hypothetical protein